MKNKTVIGKQHFEKIGFAFSFLSIGYSKTEKGIFSNESRKYIVPNMTYFLH